MRSCAAKKIGRCVQGRLVHYSISLADGEQRPELIAQLDASAGTLREHNPGIPAAVFLYGSLSADLAAVCRSHGLMVQEQGPYERRLAELCPAGWPALARYPLLHRFLNFRELAARRRDPGALPRLRHDLLRRRRAPVRPLRGRRRRRARGGPHEPQPARRRPRLRRRAAAGAARGRRGGGRDPAVQPRRRPVRPRSSRDARGLRGAVRRLRVALRPVDGAAPRDGAAAAFGEFLGAAEALALTTPDALARALPYPSTNRWILDEVALWMTLGHVPGLRVADFDRGDVAENGEFSAARPAGASWVLCHYYSQNASRIDAWLRSHRAAA